MSIRRTAQDSFSPYLGLSETQCDRPVPRHVAPRDEPIHSLKPGVVARHSWFHRHRPSSARFYFLLIGSAQPLVRHGRCSRSRSRRVRNWLCNHQNHRRPVCPASLAGSCVLTGAAGGDSESIAWKQARRLFVSKSHRLDAVAEGRVLNISLGYL